MLTFFKISDWTQAYELMDTKANLYYTIYCLRDLGPQFTHPLNKNIMRIKMRYNGYKAWSTMCDTVNIRFLPILTS